MSGLKSVPVCLCFCLSLAMTLTWVWTQILVWQTCIAGRFLHMLHVALPVQQVNTCTTCIYINMITPTFIGLLFVKQVVLKYSK